MTASGSAARTRPRILPVVPTPVDFRWTIVPHTHWDREWYLPFEVFRLRLARTIDDLLDLLDADPRFAAFTLDGQSSILEDYLEIRPDQEPRLRRHLASGRIVTGPAYVLPDEYLAPQEALIRNLQLGIETCRRHGARPMGVGYQPDPFGHVAQLPQILRGFGLDTFLFWRGLGDDAERLGALFTWRGPDGSELLAIRLLGSYGNASELGRWGRDGRDHGAEPASWQAVAVDRLRRYLDRYGREVERDGVRPILLCNGSDHQPAWEPLPGLVEGIRQAYPGIEVAIGTYEDHVRALREAGVDERRPGLPVVAGELREGREANILRGIDSARMYLKQACERATEALLTAETLATSAWLAGRGTDPRPALRRGWQQLLRNLPHDSISGCSTDDVHREMLVRFATVEQIARRVERESLAALAGTEASWTDPDPVVACVSVVDPLPYPRRVVAAVPIPDDLRGARALVADTPVGSVRAQRSGDVALVPLATDGIGGAAVRLRAAIAADGRDGLAAATPVARVAGPVAIENDRYRVEAATDGSVTLTDRRTGYSIAGLGHLEDVGDRGDEYDFSPIHEEIPWTSKGVRARRRVRTGGPVVAELEIAYDAVLAARLTPDRARRAGSVRCHVRTIVRLAAGVERVEFVTTIDNRAHDHRLRVTFPSPEARDTVRAEGHFAVLRRPARPAPPTDPERWVQLPQGTNHTTGFVAAGPLVVTGRGLPEYEAMTRADGGLTIALTLLRCVGWLARTDLSTRTEDAGPAIETPDAQCPGVHVFEYAVSLDGALEDAPLVRASADYRRPVRIGPTGIGEVFPIEVAPDVAFSAFAAAADGHGAMLRLYNPSSGPSSGVLRARGATVERVRLDETRLDDRGVPRGLGPSEVATFRVAPPR